MSPSLALPAPTIPTLFTMQFHSYFSAYRSTTGHVCRSILLSGFEAGLGASQRAEAVDVAVTSATVLTDKSHWGIIRVEGEDRLRFLHSQGTNAFEGVTEGAWQRWRLLWLICWLYPTSVRAPVLLSQLCLRRLPSGRCCLGCPVRPTMYCKNQICKTAEIDRSE